MGCIAALFRIPIGVVLGFIVMMAGLFAGLSAVMVFAGAPFCFAGDSWIASDRFCAAILGVTALSALAGGFTAMRIGGTAAIVLLCLLVGSLGALTATGKLREPDSVRFKDRPEERPDDLGPMQAAQWSETPEWCEWGKSAVGVAGLAVGAAVGAGRTRGAKRPKPRGASS